MGNVKVHGIIIRQTDYSDTDRIFTVLSLELGTIRVMAKGVRQRKTVLSVCRLFLYGEFVLYEGRNMYYMNAVDMIHDFFNLAQDIEYFALACYMADLSENVLMERAGDEQLMKLLLHSFYFMEQKKYIAYHIKTVFEWRLARYAGYCPDMESCEKCHTHEKLYYFSISQGHVYCEKCGSTEADAIKISPAIYEAICYILKAPDSRAFSFKIASELLMALNQISEQYVEYHCKSDPATLDYFRHVSTLFSN